MTSQRPYWCPKTMKRRPCWCPKQIPWELTLFLCKRLLLFLEICIDADHVSENTLLGTGHYVRRGGREKREGGAVKAISDWQFDRMVYFKRGSLAKMGKADKQYKQYM